MRPSHLLLVLFAGFAVTVWQQSPGADGSRSNGGGKPKPVVHKWNGTRPAPDRMIMRGRLVDVAGRPVVGAKVWNVPGAVTRSDVSGHFELQAARDRSVWLYALAKDGRQATWTLLPDDEVLTVVLRPKRPWRTPGGPLTKQKPYGGVGVVRNARGRATITVCETGARVRTDAGGNYRIQVPQREFHLIAHDGEGGVAMSEAIAAPRPDQRWMPLPALALQVGLDIAGYLKDGSGDPVIGGALILRGHGEERRLASGPGGSFGAKGLLAGEFVIEALPFEGEVGRRHEFHLAAGANPDLELTLRAEKPLPLLVEDASGTPQAGVFVQVCVSDDTWSAGCTDAAGRVEIRGLPAGERSFEVYRRREALEIFESLRVLRYEQAAGRLVVR